MSEPNGTIEITGKEGEMPTFKITIINDEVAGEGSFWDFVQKNTTSDKLTEFVDIAFEKQPELKEAAEGSQIKLMDYLAHDPEALEKFLWRHYCNHISDIFMDTFKTVEIKKPDEEPKEDKPLQKMTVIPDDVYEQFILQIHRLPQRKRKKWKESIRDKWGKKTEVRWRFNKLMENQGENRWIEVQSDTQMFDQADDKGYSTTPEGGALMTKHLMKKAEGKKYNVEAIEEVYQNFLATCSRLRTKATQEGAQSV